jgi:hypothetical protein
MFLPLLLLAFQDAAPDTDRVGAAMASYRERTRAEIPCKTTNDDGEIVVCARREADKYRVPFVPAGSPQNSVPLRTATLTKDYGLMDCGQRAIIAGCGPGFGVGVTVGADGSTRMIERKLAP